MHLLSGVWAKRVAACAFIISSCVVASAQSAAPLATLPSPIDSLNPSQQVISISACPNVVAEAGVDTVNYSASFSTPYATSNPVVFFWVNETTGQIDFTGMSASETAPTHDTSYEVVAWDAGNGNWGWSTMKVTVTDTTAPQIWLLGAPTMQVAGGTPWIDPGVGVFDNEDGASVPVVVTGTVNTNAVGVYTLTYTATDSHNNSSSVTRTVDVFYSWSGFTQPVNMNGQSVFKLGSCVPLKFTLTGGNANLTGGIVAKLYLAKMSNGIAGSELEATAVGSADSGNVFNFQNGTYTYNLSTKGMSAGTWQLTVDMGDGALHTAVISLSN